MKFASILTPIALASVAIADTITVQVGSSDGSTLAYSPNSISAKVGDQVVFNFNPRNHSVVQASFSSPCVPMDGGFFSGFQPSTEGPATFTIDVNSTDPIWFYCSQTLGDHCQSGMVGVINGPSSGNTLSAFAEAAQKVASSESPAEIQGGVLAKGGSDSSASGSASAAASTDASTAASTAGSTAGSTAASSSSAPSSASSAAPASTSSTAAGGGGGLYGNSPPPASSSASGSGASSAAVNNGAAQLAVSGSAILLAIAISFF